MEKLCFIRGNFAYFTDNLESQFGENWNESSSEYIPGEPNTSNGEKIEIIAFRSNAETPEERYAPDSRYSVQQINQGQTPWLFGGLWAYVSVYAGCSIEEFAREIEKDGGEVFTKYVITDNSN